MHRKTTIGVVRLWTIKEGAIVGNTGHCIEEVDLEGLNKLNAKGVKIDTLTPEQQKHLASREMGTQGQKTGYQRQKTGEPGVWKRRSGNQYVLTSDLRLLASAFSTCGIIFTS